MKQLTRHSRLAIRRPSLAWAAHMRWKIMLPFLVLTAAVAGLGSYIVTGLVTGSLQERFTNQLVDSSRAASDAFVRTEQRHLDIMRTVAFTQGVSGAVTTAEPEALQRLIDPLAINAGAYRVEVLDAQGRSLYGTELLNSKAATYGPIAPAESATASWSIVADSLAGRSDGYGDKWAQVVETASGPALFTAGPIISDGSIIGVIVVGTPFSAILPRARDEILANVTIYSPAGRTLASSFALPASGLASLAPGEPISLTSSDVHREYREVLGRRYDMLFAPMVVRGEVVGVHSVALSTDYIAGAGASARWQMAVFFFGVALVVLVVGWMLARHLTGPLGRLVSAARALALGDLSIRSEVRTHDEIGELAVSFDAMAERLQRQHIATIGALASAIDARDPYTAGHSIRVGQLSAALGRELGMASAAVHNLQVGGILHDIGKIGVRDGVLLKQGSLTPEERALIEEHPSIGLRILAPAGLSEEVLAIVGGHHERLNGTGYPARLHADDLTIFPRIAAVGDVYDALTTDRPYRTAMTSAEALRLLRREAAGGLLDPDVVDAMRRIANAWEEHRRSRDPAAERLRILNIVRAA